MNTDNELIIDNLASAGTYALRDVTGRVVAERVWLDSASPIAGLKTV